MADNDSITVTGITPKGELYIKALKAGGVERCPICKEWVGCNDMESARAAEIPFCECLEN